MLANGYQLSAISRRLVDFAESGRLTAESKKKLSLQRKYSINGRKFT